MRAQHDAMLFVSISVLLLAVGLWRNAWWTLAGGVASAALAAWRATEDA